MSGNIQGLIASIAGQPIIIGHTTAYDSSASSIVVNTPTGTGANDFLIVFLTSSTAASVFTSSGWSEVYGSGSFASSYARQTCLYRQLSSAPAANYTFSIDRSRDITAVMIAIRPAGSPASSGYKTFSTTSSTSHVAPDPFPALTRSGLLLCGFGFDRSATSGMTASTPAGMSQVAYEVGDGTNTMRATLVCQQNIGTGFAGTRTSTTSQSVQSFNGSVVIVAK